MIYSVPIVVHEFVVPNELAMRSVAQIWLSFLAVLAAERQDDISQLLPMAPPLFQETPRMAGAFTS